MSSNILGYFFLYLHFDFNEFSDSPPARCPSPVSAPAFLPSPKLTPTPVPCSLPDPPVQALLGLCQCQELEDTAVEQLLSTTQSPSEQVSKTLAN